MENIIKILDKKVLRKSFKTILLSIMGGIFIGLGAWASLIVLVDVDFGLAKFLQGIVFSTGLILITLTGAELFTGNVWLILNLLEKKIKIKDILKNWILVYFGNFIGALLIVLFVYNSANFSLKLENIVEQVATFKTNLNFLQCFISGMLCNLLVCLAVWLASKCKNTVEKIFSIIFPILIFIIAGYEHCIANMFFLPLGMFINDNVSLVNLIPVTLGNITGAFLFVVLPYWKVNLR